MIRLKQHFDSQMIKPLLSQSDKDKEVYAHNTYSDQEELSLMQTHGLQKDYNNGKPTERLKESNRRKFKKPCRVKPLSVIWKE